MDQQCFEALEDRLTNLERQNRRLKQTCMVMVGALTIGLLTGAQVVKDSFDIREQLLIRDRDNTVRFDIGVDKVQGLQNGLLIFDKDGKRRIVLSVSDDGSATLGFYDRNGQVIKILP
jgi:hypothetical protein